MPNGLSLEQPPLSETFHQKLYHYLVVTFKSEMNTEMGKGTVTGFDKSRMRMWHERSGLNRMMVECSVEKLQPFRSVRCIINMGNEYIRTRLTISRLWKDRC